MEGQPQQELLIALKHLESFSIGDFTKLKKSIYDSLSGICHIIIEGKKNKFKRGWMSNVLDRYNEPVFNKNESDTIETLCQTFVKPLFDPKGVQHGGANDPLTHLANTSTKEGVSINVIFSKVKDYIKGLDDQASHFSRELGPFKFFYDGDTDIPVYGPVRLPPNSIPVLIRGFTEGIRLIFSLSPISNDITRQILSVVLAIIELCDGRWKHGLLSLAGIFGEYPLIVGLIGKITLSIFGFMSASTQEKFLDGSFDAVKSTIVGFLLWAFSIVAPDFARVQVNQGFVSLKEMIHDLSGKYSKIKDNIGESVKDSLKVGGATLESNKPAEANKPAEIKTNTPRITLEESIPTRLTPDEIQGLQELAKHPDIICTTEFQDIVKKISSFTLIRVSLELFGVPTDPRQLMNFVRNMVNYWNQL